LIFVGLQMKQDRDVAIAEATIASFSHSLELRNQRFEHINVWNSGIAGMELDVDQREIFRGLIVSAHQYAFMIWSSLDRVGLENVEFAVSDFAGFLYQNPAARLEWEAFVDEVDSFRELPGEEFQRNTNWEDTVRLRIKEISEAYD
jgi:hypothetical protein